MTNPIAQELYEQFQRLEAKFQGPNVEPYAFHEGEPWNAALARLPRTSRLWKAFQRFDAARTAYEAHRDLMQGWKRDLRVVGQRLSQADQVLTNMDLDAFDRDTLRQLTLERLLERQAQPHQELKTVAERETTVWEQTWQDYQNLLIEEQRIGRATFAGSAVGFDVRRDAVSDNVRRRKRFEAA